MAKRIVFYVENKQFKRAVIDFQWFPGFAKVQAQKSVQSLHQNFKKDHPAAKLLEVSSASPIDFATQASAFNLTVRSSHDSEHTVEQLFQAAKFFKKNGSQQKLLEVSSREAKRQMKELNRHDQLDHFEIFGKKFPLEPKTFFYNWTYICALHQHQQLAQKILQYNAFTDIYFNDQKSFNCQADACSIYVALSQQHRLDEALKSRENFLQIVYNQTDPQSQNSPKQLSLF